MTIERLECFSLIYHFSPPRGPSIAYGDEHSYAIVKLTDSDGVSGWGETYLVPGVTSIIETVAPLLIGRQASDALELKIDVARTAQHAYANSAISIAIDDLRARQLGVPIYDLYGGARRDKVRAYAAIEGYIEGVDPAESWPSEVDSLAAKGYTAIKMRIGRYPLAKEAPLYEQVRRDLPASVDLCADGNGGYTLRQAIETGQGPRRARLPLVRGAAPPVGRLRRLRDPECVDAHRAGGRRDHDEPERGARASSIDRPWTSSSPSP